MSNYVSKYTLRFNDLASKGLLRVARVAGGMTRSLANIGGVAAGVGTGLIYAATRVNRLTAEQERLAQSVGISRDSIVGLEGVAKSIGLEFDNIIDLQEEINNKFGEMAAAGELPVTALEGLKGLGFTESEFENISRIADINTLVDKALQSVANGSRTVAEVQSALDQIAGGEANKILGAALARGVTSVEELNEQYRRLSVYTDKGADGAIRYSSSISDLNYFMTNLVKEGFGRLGGAFAPIIEAFTQFLAANNDVIKSGIDTFIADLSTSLALMDWQSVFEGARDFAGKLKEVITTVWDVVEALGGAGNVLQGFAALFAIGKVAEYAGKLRMLASILGGPLTIGLGIAVAAGIFLYRNWDTIKQKAQELWEKMKPVGEWFQSTWASAMEVASAAGDRIKASWEDLKASAQGIWDKLKGFTDWIFNGLAIAYDFMISAGEQVMANWEEIKTSAQAFWQVVVDAATRIQDGFNGAMQSIITVATNAWEGVKSIVAQGLNFIIDKINAVIAQYNNLAATGVGEFVGLEQAELLQRLDVTGTAKSVTELEGTVRADIHVTAENAEVRTQTTTTGIVDSDGSNLPVSP